MTPRKPLPPAVPAPDRAVWRLCHAGPGRMVPITLARVSGLGTPYQRGHVLASCGGRQREVGGDDGGTSA
jgi:hypothetical protein